MLKPIDQMADTDQEPDEIDDSPDTQGSNLGWLDSTQWDDKKLAKLLIQRWKDRDPEFRPKLVRWEVNERRRRGDRWIGLIKNPDRNEWRIYTPPGGSKTPPTLGKAARLCRRLTSQMFQDQPTPEAMPATDADQDRSAAEFATRILTAMASEAGVNSTRSARISYNKSHTYGSGFRYWWVDPFGGGQTPKRLMAHPEAPDPAQPTLIQAIDPTSTALGDTTALMGSMSDDMGPLAPPVSLMVQSGGYASSPPMEEGDPGALTMRMVTPADDQGKASFTDDESAAEWVFIPKLRCTVLTGKTLRMFPPTALDIADAESVQMLIWTTLGDLKRRYKDVLDAMEPSDLKKLVEWKPEGEWKYLIPDHLRQEDIDNSRQKVKGSEDYQDSAIVCVFHTYHTVNPDFSQGAYIVSGGPEMILCRDPWVKEVDGTKLILDLPVDQTKGFDEGNDDQYGMGAMDFLGPGDELLASVDSAWITHFQRFSNRKVFVPITSALQNKVMQGGMGMYVPINPGGEPKAEPIPDFPRDTLTLRQKIVDNMDDESGLQLTAQGVDSPNVQSGFHAVQVIEQVLAGLSEPRQNCADAIERGYRIQLQQIRAFYTVPQQTKFLGSDQDYKYDYWLASDLGSTTDVRILRGTFSMMSPAMKSSIAVSMQQAGVITPYELRRFTIGGTGGMIGIEDDPHWMRVSRQVAAWRKGPPEGWTPPPPMPVDPMMGAPLGPPASASAVGASPAAAPPMAGGPAPVGGVPQAPAMPAPPVWTPFEILPIDSDPGIATMRVQELARAMAGTDYAKSDPDWRGLLDTAYNQAVQASQPPPAAPPPPPAPAIVNNNFVGDSPPTEQSVGALPPGIATNEGQPGANPPVPGAPPTHHSKPILPLPHGDVPPDAALAGMDQPGAKPSMGHGDPNLSGVNRSPLPPGKFGPHYEASVST